MFVYMCVRGRIGEGGDRAMRVGPRVVPLGGTLPVSWTLHELERQDPGRLAIQRLYRLEV